MTARLIRFDELTVDGNCAPLYVHPADVNTVRLCEDTSSTEIRVQDNVYRIREDLEDAVRTINEALVKGDEEEATRCK